MAYNLKMHLNLYVLLNMFAMHAIIRCDGAGSARF
jgi:hypothetical protein